MTIQKYPPTVGRLVIGQADCRRFDRSSELEWLEANGLGSFASGTVSGAHTRRYHGLLCAALQPPVARVLTLSRLEDNVCVAGREMALGTNVYKSTTVHPEGFRLLKSFELDPWPVWTYDVLGMKVQREIAMIHERQGVFVRYSSINEDQESPEPLMLRLRPLFAWRGYHDIKREAPEREVALERADGSDRRWIARAARNHTPRSIGESRHPEIAVPADLKLHFESSHPLLVLPEHHWYFDFSYAIEAHRGDPTREDMHSPGEIFVEVPPGESFTIWIGLEPLSNAEPSADLHNQALQAERERRCALAVPQYESSPVGCRLSRAADQFIVRRRKDLYSVIAGYPWFTDWGRDTMIALPGLTLTTGKTDVALKILTAFSSVMNKGIIPNRFPDENDIPEYNTVDATLWMFEATARYVNATGDWHSLEHCLYRSLCDVVEWHTRGTHYNITVDPADGLLRGESRGIQLTWMDAKADDTVFTPRYGKPVEINALWVNALRHLESWAHRFGDVAMAQRCEALAEKASESFNLRFRIPGLPGLADVVDGDGPGTYDGKLRPNQIFAVSLPHTPLAPEHFGSVVDAVAASLITPRGLRSLSADDPQYKPVYAGDRFSRDASYHQGTVWSWLIGPFIEAYFRTYGQNLETRRHAWHLVSPLILHLEECGLGQISEIFDGNPPHAARGCFAQAWSVAELLRVLVEYNLFEFEEC